MRDVFKGLLLFVLLLSFVNKGSGVPIFVNIRDTLEGHFPINNVSMHDGMIDVNVVWENLGSVTCDTYLRVDVLDNESEVLDTFWSGVKEVTPGDSAYYEVFIYLHNYTGNITLRQRFYYCNEISLLREINLSYNSSDIERGNKEVNMSYEFLNNNTIRIVVKVNESINGSVYVLPQKTPIGWVVESRRINIINGRGEGRLYLQKPVRSEKELNMYLLLTYSNKTQEYKRKISLVGGLKKEEKYNWPFIVSMIFNVVLLLVVLYLVRDKRPTKKEDSGKKREKMRK